MKGLGTDDNLLINITALFSDYMRDRIEEVYYDVTDGGILRNDIKNDTSGGYRRLLLGLWGYELE